MSPPSSTALHVKYRPTDFDLVLGQDATVKSLEKAVKANRAHTFLFVGPSGTGKTTLARIVGSKFCGGSISPANLIEIDAATHTGAEAMRAVTRDAAFKAMGVNPNKVIIVDEAHRLSAAAWESLLKVTEEPAPHVYWVLCTTNVAKVPATITTRFLKYVLKPVSDELLLELVAAVTEMEGLKVPKDVLETIAEGSGGSPRQALVNLELCAYAEDEAEARKLMREAGEGSKEIVDYCRFLLKPNGGWPAAMKLIKAIDADAESIRIVVSNYFAAVAGSDTKNLPRLLFILECFEQPFNSSDKNAPLLLATGRVLGIGQ